MSGSNNQPELKKDHGDEQPFAKCGICTPDNFVQHCAHFSHGFHDFAPIMTFNGSLRNSSKLDAILCALTRPLSTKSTESSQVQLWRSIEARRGKALRTEIIL